MARATASSTDVPTRMSASKRSKHFLQTTIVRAPPGFSERRRLRSAATGLSKNIVPKREKT